MVTWGKDAVSPLYKQQIQPIGSRSLQHFWAHQHMQFREPKGCFSGSQMLGSQSATQSTGHKDTYMIAVYTCSLVDRLRTWMGPGMGNRARKSLALCYALYREAWPLSYVPSRQPDLRRL